MSPTDFCVLLCNSKATCSVLLLWFHSQASLFLPLEGNPTASAGHSMNTHEFKILTGKTRSCHQAQSMGFVCHIKWDYILKITGIQNTVICINRTLISRPELNDTWPKQKQRKLILSFEFLLER